MRIGSNSRPIAYKPVKPPRTVHRAFGRLKVRQKLAILHNIFFFVLAISVYLSVIPLFSRHLESARDRELNMMGQIFEAELPMISSQQERELSVYDYQEGSAAEVGLPPEGRQFLAQYPERTWTGSASTLFRNAGEAGRYRRVSLSQAVYGQALRDARITLFVVLGTIYILSIIVMEFLIMPQYVYQPLQLMLRADEATQSDDRENEMIDDQFILNDEIGQIMRSRNATVAQLRHHEDTLASALLRLEEQDRLVSLGLLSTSVAHELNTPLAVLQGSIEKLLETTRDTPTLERLARMLRVTQRLRKISEGLVDFARVRKQETESIPLRPIIEESWNLVAIDEKASTVAIENLVSEDVQVIGNSDRLVQVYVNLLRNALNAVTADGRIQVQSRVLQRNGQSCVCCMVSDNGPGIPEQVLPNLFEAFVTTRLDARGTGLGLTVAEGIVTQHGGTICASNRPEGGACLEVVLPAG